MCGGLRSRDQFVKMSDIRACLCVHENDRVEEEKLVMQERGGLLKCNFLETQE